MSYCSHWAMSCHIVAIINNGRSYRAGDLCLKISELLEESERLHEQTLSRQHEVKAVLTALNCFNSRAESLSEKLAAFRAKVGKQVTRPLSTDVDVIRADLQLIKVLRDFYVSSSSILPYLFIISIVFIICFVELISFYQPY